MSQDQTIKELLGLAVADVEPRPGGAGPELFRRAARVRRRRRVAAVGTALALTGTLVAGGLVLADGHSGPADRVKMVDPAKKGTPVEILRALLPRDVGTITQLADQSRANEDAGALDGVYLIHKNGKVGALTITWGLTLPYTPKCDASGKESGERSCTATALGDGRQIMVKELGPDEMELSGAMQYRTLGSKYRAMFSLGNVRMLQVAAVCGLKGTPSPGPPMDAPPLTKEQLATLAQRPELQVGAALGPQTEDSAGQGSSGH